MSRTAKLDRLLTVVLVIAALAVAFSVIRREFRPNPGGPLNEAVFFPEWRSILADGIQLGEPDADVQIIEFVDLECPFCARFHRDVLGRLLDGDSAAVGVTFVHFPLPMHRFADLAATAAECSSNRSFKAFVDDVFEKQDSLGLKAWWTYGNPSFAFTDSAEFVACMAAQESPRIAAGRQWGERVGVRGTPTVIVNGWRLPRPPTADELARITARIVNGEELTEKDVALGPRS